MNKTRKPSKNYPAAILVLAVLGTGAAAGQEPAENAEESAFQLGAASYRLAVEEEELRQQLAELKAATTKRQQEIERQMAKLAEARAKARHKAETELRGKVDAAWGADLARVFEAVPMAQRWRVGLQIAADSQRGVTVAGTEKGSPAEGAGIEKGDVVAAVNGIQVKQIQALQAIINAAGDQELTLSLKRAKENLDVRLTPEAIEHPQPHVRVFPRAEAWGPEGWQRQFEQWRAEPAPGDPNPPRVFEWRPQQRPASGPNTAEIQALKKELEQLRKLVEGVVEEREEEEDDDESD